MTILDQYGYYETVNFYNFTPQFPSEVSRISVIRKGKNNNRREIIVEKINGLTSFHALSELESLLHGIFEDRK